MTLFELAPRGPGKLTRTSSLDRPIKVLRVRYGRSWNGLPTIGGRADWLSTGGDFTRETLTGEGGISPVLRHDSAPVEGFDQLRHELNQEFAAEVEAAWETLKNKTKAEKAIMMGAKDETSVCLEADEQARSSSVQQYASRQEMSGTSSVQLSDLNSCTGEGIAGTGDVCGVFVVQDGKDKVMVGSDGDPLNTEEDDVNAISCSVKEGEGDYEVVKGCQSGPVLRDENCQEAEGGAAVGGAENAKLNTDATTSDRNTFGVKSSEGKKVPANLGDVVPFLDSGNSIVGNSDPCRITSTPLRLPPVNLGQQVVSSGSDRCDASEAGGEHLLQLSKSAAEVAKEKMAARSARKLLASARVESVVETSNTVEEDEQSRSKAGWKGWAKKVIGGPLHPLSGSSAGEPPVCQVAAPQPVQVLAPESGSAFLRATSRRLKENADRIPSEMDQPGCFPHPARIGRSASVRVPDLASWHPENADSWQFRQAGGMEKADKASCGAAGDFSVPAGARRLAELHSVATVGNLGGGLWGKLRCQLKKTGNRKVFQGIAVAAA